MNGTGRTERFANDRGQTNIDFVVGIVIFLLAFSFVVATTPQLLSPFEDQEDPVVAERVTTTLAESLLVGDAGPGSLDTECTAAFFDAGSASASGCPFTASETRNERVGVENTYRVNVTLAWNVSGGPQQEILCYDDSDNDTGDCAVLTDSGDDKLATGPPVPDSKSTASERRTVVVEGQARTLRVRVW